METQPPDAMAMQKYVSEHGAERGHCAGRDMVRSGKAVRRIVLADCKVRAGADAEIASSWTAREFYPGDVE